MNDLFYMKKALELAREASSDGEVPVGAIAVWDDEKCETIIGSGRNRREKKKNALCHAEIEAINNACNTKKGWRLHKCTLYVTLEPCPMCAGAIVNSRIKRLVFAAKDEKSGAFGSVFNINDIHLNHKCDVVSGVMENESSQLLSDFFSDLRKTKNNK